MPPVRFSLLTDVHYGPQAFHEGRLCKLSDRGPELVQRFVARMRHDVKPDLVVSLGDIVEDESTPMDESRYRAYCGALAALDCPVLHVAGNHDLVNMSPAFLSESWGRPGPLYYRTCAAELQFIVLQSQELKDQRVFLPDAQLAWLTEQLAQVEKECIVLVHHPLSDLDLVGNHWFEAVPQLCRIENRQAVRRILEGAHNASGKLKVRAVFNGHVHQNHCDVIGGIPYITLQSLIENVDVGGAGPGRPANTHAVVSLDEERLLVNVFGEQPAHYQFHA